MKKEYKKPKISGGKFEQTALACAKQPQIAWDTCLDPLDPKESGVPGCGAGWS